METNNGIIRSTKEMYTCPFCKMTYQNKWEAELCYANKMGIDRIKQNFVPFDWYFLRSRHLADLTKWILVGWYEIREKYDWEKCAELKLWFQNVLDSGEQFNVAPQGDWEIIQHCDLLTGWTAHGLYPANPSRYFKFTKHTDWHKIKEAQRVVNTDIACRIQEMSQLELQTTVYKVFTGIMAHDADAQVEDPKPDFAKEIIRRVAYEWD